MLSRSSACRFYRCTTTPFRHQSSHYQLYAVYDWLCWLCNVTQEGISEAAVRPVLLGSYEPATYCSVEVRNLWICSINLLTLEFSHFIVNNILEGLIWFWVPASLVICNDVFAYVWGVTLGRTPLIKLSPKKTLEGFVGAFFSTVIFGVFWGTYFMRFAYMTCPVHDLGVSAWSSMKCEPNPVFMWKVWQTPAPLNMLLNTVRPEFLSALSGIVGLLTDNPCLAWLGLAYYRLCTISVPSPIYVLLCLARCTFRRVFCLWL